MRRLSLCLLLAGFVLTIFGSKLALIGFGASDLPFMDQWDGEAETAFRPWLEHRLDFKILLHPHNEHRIATTRLYALALLRANGQWSARLEMIGNAALHTAAAFALLLIARRWLRGGALVAFGVLLAAAFTLPFSWENSLSGFQVQFYFLVLFSLGHLALVLRADRCGPAWWLGQTCGLLAVASMASGFLSSLAVLAVLAWRLARERRWSPSAIATASVSLVFVLLGWFARETVPGHAPLRAHSVGQFLHSFGQLLAWPGPLILPLALMPAALVLWFAFRRRAAFPSDPVLLGLGAWTLLQCAALAYGRGGSDMVLSSRYLDLLAINLAVGFVLLCVTLAGTTRRLVVGGWLIAVLIGLSAAGYRQFRDAVVPNLAWHQQQEDNVRAYLRTDDPSVLQGKNWPEIPYVNAPVLEQRLAVPGLRAILPPVVQPGLPLPSASPDAPPPRDLPAGVPLPSVPVALSTYAVAGAAPFVWRSAPQRPSPLPLLRFRVAGDLSASTPALRFVLKSAAGETPLEPDSMAGLRWKTVTVAAPSGDWWIEATDADPHGWFAVTEPVAVGRLTWLGEKLLKYERLITVFGIVLLLAGAILALRTAGPLPRLRAPRIQIPVAWRAAAIAPLRRPLSTDPRVIWGSVIAAILLLIAHKPWALTQPQLWAEDGSVHLIDNDLHGAGAFFLPYRGYLHLLPRLIAWFASQLADVAFWPLIYNTCSLLVAVALFVRYASPRLNLPGKPWLILAFVLAAHTGEVFLNITNLHWLTAFFLMAQVLIDRPTTPRQRAIDLGLLAVIGLTGPFIVVFMPLIAWRWWRDRHRDNLAVLLVAGTCAAIQLYFIKTTGPTYAPQLQPLNLSMLLTVAGSRLVVWPFFGESAALHLPHPLLAGFGIVFIAAVVLWGLRPHPRRLLRLQAIAAFGLFAALCLYRIRPDTWAQPDLENGDSYFYIPRILLAWLVIWETDAGPRFAVWAARALCGLAVLFELPHHHEPARPDYHWAENCDPIRRGTPANIPILPEGWILLYPGRPSPP